MPQSNCSRCGSHEFEVVHAQNIEGTTRAILFVQCSQCGAVVGALDFVNLGVQASHIRDEVERTIEKLRKSLER